MLWNIVRLSVSYVFCVTVIPAFVQIVVNLVFGANTCGADELRAMVSTGFGLWAGAWSLDWKL